MGTEALIGGLFGLASAGVSAVTAHHTQAANAAAQSELNEATMKFNREEAAKARDWQHTEGAFSRNFALYQQQAAQQFNAEQILAAREYDTRMANTAHQREVADLKAAGLNPILSATKGNNGAASPVSPVLASPVASSAGTPMGSTASVGGLQAYRKENYLGAFANTALEGLRLSNDVKRAKAEEIRAESERLRAQTDAKRAVQEIEESISRVGLNMDQHEINQIRKMSEQELVNKLRSEITEIVTRTKDNHDLSKAEQAAVMINANAYAGLASSQARLADIRGELESAKNPSEIKRLEALADQAKKSSAYYEWIISDPESNESRKYFENNPQHVPIREAVNDISKLFRVNIGAHGLFSIGGDDSSYKGTKIGF